MAARWHFLDNADGDQSDKSLSVTSKWWFYGTLDELYAWLPAYKANANFALKDSTDGTSGTRWCPDAGGGTTVFQIQSKRFTALDRFEYNVDVTAIDFSKGGSGGGGSFSWPDKSKLVTESTNEMSLGTFVMSPNLIGYDLNANGETIDLEVAGTWSKTKDYPFTLMTGPPDRLPPGFLNRTLFVVNVREVSFLSGTPASNKATLLAFKNGTTGQTLAGITGRVVERNMRLVRDSAGTDWTEWARAIQQAPTDLVEGVQIWNYTGWKDC